MPAAVAALRVGRDGQREAGEECGERRDSHVARSYPLQAQPGGWWHVSVFAMQALPHAFPVVHTAQQAADGAAVELLLHATVRGGPLAAARVSTSAPATRTFLQTNLIVSTRLPL